MLNVFRFRRSGVSSRLLGITILIAILFVVGCTTKANIAQFAVTTTSASLPAGSISTGATFPSTTLTASNGTAPYTWAVTTGSLPAGLNLSPAGVISGTATASGTFPFTVMVTDSATPTAHTATANLSITINAKLTITSAGTLTTVGAAGSAYSASISATGGVGPFTWTVNTGNLPTGLGLSGTSGTGTISGTISSSAAPGSYNFTAKITDSQGGVGISGTITITVDPALTITPPTLPTGVVGVNYAALAFTAAGGSGTGYNFTIASGALPGGLTLGAATGLISAGPPTIAGPFTFTVKVTDSLGFTATTGSLNITINPAITVGLAPASPVTLDQGKTQLVTATANNDPNTAGVNWSAVTGLGTLTGQTTTSATYNAPGSVAVASAATFTATSVTDPTKSKTFTINLVPPPQITTTTMAAGNVNGAYSSPVNMSGGVGPFTWLGTTLPPGLSLSSSTTSTVTVQGTPTVAGVGQTFTIKVTDAQGLSVTSSGLTITIYPTLTITPPAFPTGVVGVSYSSPAFTPGGGSGTGYTFAVASGSTAPLSIGSASGIITGTPTTSGTLNFTIKVTDSVGNVATTGPLSITINPAITVGLSPTSPVTLDQGKTQLVTATVNNDPNTAGVNWSAVTGLGTLTGQTSSSVTYNAPASVGAASSATFTATSVTDPTKSATFTVNLVPPPQITTTTMAAGNVNGAYSSPVNVSGGVAPYTWAIMAAPTGLTLSSSTTSTVTVQGAPTVAGANQTFTIKVTDAQGLSVTSSGLTITVYAALVLTPPSSPLPTGAVGVNYPTSETFTASGGSGTGYTWSVVAGNPLPTGLSLSSAAGASTSITAGPPTAAGTFPFTVKLMDSVGNTATTSGLSITINPPINVVLSPAQPFAMDQNTIQLITATVNNDPSSGGVTWSVLTGLGSLTGSTSTTITYNAPAVIASTSIATFTATSVTDPTKSASFSVSLEPPPVIATPSFPVGTTNVAYGPSAVTVNGGVGPFTWLGTTLPPGLSLSSSTTSTVNVQGAPTSAGANQTVTIKVTDAKGLTNTLNSTITINAPSCSSNCTISGNVSGPVNSGVTIALSGGPTSKPNTATDSSGNYSFTGLAGGTYTVTPSLAGYTFGPSTPAVTTTSSTTTQNFVETSALASYSISGTVTYAGAKTGRVFVRVLPSGCNNCNAVAGTSIVLTSGSGSYTVRGLLPSGAGQNGNGSFTVFAEMDTLSTGEQNDSNPSGSYPSTVTITNANVTGINVTLTDASPTPGTPDANKISISPGNGLVAIQYQASVDSNGVENATAYKVYYGTDNPPTNGSGSPKTFKAQGQHQNVFILSGLTNGATNFQMSAVAGATESTKSNMFSTTIGATTGSFTVSGTVTFPAGMGNGPLYVGVYGGPTGNTIYAERIPTPYVSGVSYSVSGVPNGTYQNFAIIDENNDGEIGVPDLDNVGNHSNPPTIVVNSLNVTGANLNLTSENVPTAIQVQTSYQQSGPTYSLNFQMSWGTKRPVAIALISGPNMPVPFDMNVDENNSTQSPTFGSSVVPLVGDTYQFQVLFSDGTSQNLSASVTAVLGANDVARNISETTSPLPYSTTDPLFTWAAPLLPPAVYFYGICVNGPSLNWCDFGHGSSNGLPSSQTSIQYNADGNASSTMLTSGSTYNINIQVMDANGNSAGTSANYMVP